MKIFGGGWLPICHFPYISLHNTNLFIHLFNSKESLLIFRRLFFFPSLARSGVRSFRSSMLLRLSSREGSWTGRFAAIKEKALQLSEND